MNGHHGVLPAYPGAASEGVIPGAGKLLSGPMLAFLLIGVPLLPAAAFDHGDRTAMLPTPPDQPAAILGITPEADDAFSVYLASGQVIRFGPDLKPRAAFARPELVNPWTPGDGSFEAVGTNRGPIVFNWPTFIDVPGAPPGAGDDFCRAEPLDDGTTLTLLRPNDQLTRQRDAGGGLWGIAPHQGLVRYALDCSSRIVAIEEPWQVFELRASSSEIATFGSTYDGRVFMASTTGVTWHANLPQFAEFPWRPEIRSGLIADDHFMAPYQAADGSDRLAVFDPQGRLAWTWQPDTAAELLVAQAYRSGVLLVTEDDVRFLDTAGRERWRHPTETAFLLALAQARPNDDYAWLQFQEHHVEQACDDDQGSEPCGEDPADTVLTIAYELANGAQISWALDPELRVTVGKADGSVVLHDQLAHWKDADELVHARLDGSLEPLALPQLKTMQHFVVLHRDEHGVLAATVGRGSWTLHALNPSLQRQWSVTRYGDEPVAEAALALAADAAQACILADWQRGALSLQCYHRSSGSARFAPISWEGSRGHLHPQLEGRIEVLHQSGDTGAGLARRRFTLDGSLIGVETDFIDGVSDVLMDVSEVRYSPVGHTVIRRTLGDPQSGSVDEQLVILAPGHEPGDPVALIDLAAEYVDWTPSRDNSERSFAVTADRIAIATPARWTGRPPFNRAVLEVAAHSLSNGNRIWQREFEVGLQNPEFHVQSQGQDWMVAMLDLHGLRLVRLDSGDGEPVFDQWHRFTHQARNPRELPQRADVRLLNDGDVSAIVGRRAGGTRVLWFDSDNGAFLASGLHPVIAEQPWPALPPTQTGPLTLAGRASGNDWPAPILIEPSLASRRPGSSVSAAGFAGTWFSPATTGQGWFIDVIDDVGKIFGAWFTFDDWPASDASGLRWYTMLGDLPGADGVATLTLYRNTCGAFEAGPPSQAEEIGRIRLWQGSGGGLQMKVEWLGDFGGEWLVREAHALDLAPVMAPAASGGIQHWFDPAIAGQGLLLGRPLEVEGPLVAAWFTYDLPGAENDLSCQHWFTALGPPSHNPSATREAALLQTFGGSLDGRPTRNTSTVGGISLTPIACDRLRFEYRFDDSDLAGPFAGLEGTRVLQTSGGCPPP